MVIGESLRTTLTEIWAHKMRSTLTLFGVVLGTMAVVTMVSLIEAVKVEIWNGIDSLGLRGVLFVSTETPTSNLDVKRAHLSEGLRRQDAAGLVESSEQISSAAPVSFSQQVVAWGDASQSVRITGTTRQYAVVFDRKAEEGRYICDLDVERRRRVVVIGHFLAEDLFHGRDAVGQWVRIGNHRFEVVGVGERVGNEMINDGWSRREMEGATIPLTTMQGLYGGGERIPLLMVKAANTDNLSQLFAHLKNRLWRQHNRVEDFEIENVAQEILEAEEQIDEQLRGWTIVLFAISAISLVVGGVGIFSVLQISLAERLYEIGLRKSIGAEDRDILLQFLIEAIFLSAIGAVIGFFVAVGLCAFAGQFFEAGLPISGFAVLLAIIFAISIGLLAGIYPSLRAARLTPVEALAG
ncbi:MAG: ABC transporter permease [Acidobacteria bacterium]|nr:ABC transporter permease [Candidatus Sulfomarinibacter sp. MAG AM1]